MAVVARMTEADAHTWMAGIAKAVAEAMTAIADSKPHEVDQERRAKLYRLAARTMMDLNAIRFPKPVR